MRVTVLETELYAQRSEELLSPEESEGLRSFLAEHPESGDMVPGLAGLRKVRWTHQSRNKGKRGGTRVVYFYAISHHIVVLLTLYSKDEKEDLTHADRKQLKAALAELKAEIATSAQAPQPVRKRTSKKSSAGHSPFQG